jgi:phosphatidylglycerol:prolipoprotein diacylglycerol transferase
MLHYPTFDPVAIKIGPLAVHWYGLMYIIGFALAWLLGNYRAKHSQAAWTRNQVEDVIFYSALGVILGGRIGYMLFYDLPGFWANPLVIFKVWQGGMSFHGGLLGVIISLWIYCWKNQKTFFEVTDFIAPLVPIGLAAGRIGNFINGELWGRVTHVPWAIVFPNAGAEPRHPSQLYEFLAEGILLFILLWLFSAKKPPQKAVSGLFLVGYAMARFSCEMFRQPDLQLGFVAFDWLTMGQLLCVPMFIIGIWMLRSTYKPLFKESTC